MEGNGRKPVFLLVKTEFRHMTLKTQQKKEKIARAKKPPQPPVPAAPAVDGKAFVSRITELAEPLCEAEGLELVHVEYQNEPGGRIARVYIDKPGGVLLDDCAHVSRQLSDLLDVSIDGDWAYNLEVSSPGSERPLSKPADFEKFKGQRAKIRLAEPLPGSTGGQKNFTGILAGMADGAVTLLVDDKPVSIPMRDIRRARLINNNGELECL